MINKFKSSQDYKDICYMIDHIDDCELRVEMIEKLGYLVISDKASNNQIKAITCEGKIKMQITPIIDVIGMARFVII